MTTETKPNIQLMDWRCEMDCMAKCILLSTANWCNTVNGKSEDHFVDEEMLASTAERVLCEIATTGTDQ